MNFDDIFKGMGSDPFAGMFDAKGKPQEPPKREAGESVFAHTQRLIENVRHNAAFVKVAE